jgi:uncharacterized membrane protein YeaQ/YmgE (transglycosylase-associated protein family)
MIGALILGILAGYIGKFLMPGREHEPRGFLATTGLGLVGSLAGFFIFTTVLGIGDDRIFDLGGLIGAVIGVMLVLWVYRLVMSHRDAGHGHPA